MPILSTITIESSSRISRSKSGISSSLSKFSTISFTDSNVSLFSTSDSFWYSSSFSRTSLGSNSSFFLLGAVMELAILFTMALETRSATGAMRHYLCVHLFYISHFQEQLLNWHVYLEEFFDFVKLHILFHE